MGFHHECRRGTLTGSALQASYDLLITADCPSALRIKGELKPQTEYAAFDPMHTECIISEIVLDNHRKAFEEKIELNLSLEEA